jgi:rhodanese-related sulfurtransferase
MTVLPITLLDVRTEEEVAESSVSNSLNIPHSEILNRLDEIPKNGEIAVFCRSGRRSAIVAEVLARLGYNTRDIMSFEIAKRVYKNPTK